MNWKPVMKLNWKNISRKVQIESRMMAELATSHILPAAIRYQNMLIENIKGLKDAGIPENVCTDQKQILTKFPNISIRSVDLVEKMIEARKVCNNI